MANMKTEIFLKLLTYCTNLMQFKLSQHRMLKYFRQSSHNSDSVCTLGVTKNFT